MNSAYRLGYQLSNRDNLDPRQFRLGLGLQRNGIGGNQLFKDRMIEPESRTPGPREYRMSRAGEDLARPGIGDHLGRLGNGSCGINHIIN